MPSSDPSARIAKKRKSAINPSKPSKKPCTDAGAVSTAISKATTHTDNPTATAALIGPHESIIADLSPRHDILAASIISSSQIGKRVKYALSHLVTLNEDDDDGKDIDSSSEKKQKQEQKQRKKRIVLLHARRTADVCKMLTVVELCKRTLGEKGRSWYQYNQLFEVPEEAGRDKIEETILSNQGEKEKKKGEKNEKTTGEDSEDNEDEDEDVFEPVRSRFEDAVMPPPRARTTKSLRIFLSLESIPDLREQPDVTVQSSEGT